MFQIHHGKKYESDIEDKFRMKIFMENRHKIAKHNSDYDLGIHKFRIELNQFGDMVSILNKCFFFGTGLVYHI